MLWRNILIVHQSKAVRKVVRGYLLSEFDDANVEEASEPNVALEMISARKYQVVICNKNVSGFSSAEIYEKMSASIDNQGTPIIVLTASNDEDNIREITDMGFDNYMVSPFSATDLKDKINAVSRRNNKWRASDRYHVPETEVVFHAEGRDAKGSVVNISMDGVLAEFNYTSEFAGLLDCTKLTLRFSRNST